MLRQIFINNLNYCYKSLQLGVAIGFVLPPILVANSDDLDAIGYDLQWMFNYVAGLTSILLVLIILCKFCNTLSTTFIWNKVIIFSNSLSFFCLVFQDKPPTPPSAAQKAIIPGSVEAENQITFMQSLKNLLTNPNYVLLLISYGMNVGVFYAISTLLNPVSGNRKFPTAVNF